MLDFVVAQSRQSCRYVWFQFYFYRHHRSLGHGWNHARCYNTKWNIQLNQRTFSCYLWCLPRHCGRGYLHLPSIWQTVELLPSRSISGWHRNMMLAPNPVPASMFSNQPLKRLPGCPQLISIEINFEQFKFKLLRLNCNWKVYLCTQASAPSTFYPPHICENFHQSEWSRTCTRN